MKTTKEFARLIVNLRNRDSIANCTVWGMLRKLGRKSFHSYQNKHAISSARVETIIENTIDHIINDFLMRCDCTQAEEGITRIFHEAFADHLYGENTDDYNSEFRDPFYPTLARRSQKIKDSAFFEEQLRIAA